MLRQQPTIIVWLSACPAKISQLTRAFGDKFDVQYRQGRPSHSRGSVQLACGLQDGDGVGVGRRCSRCLNLNQRCIGVIIKQQIQHLHHSGLISHCLCVAHDLSPFTGSCSNSRLVVFPSGSSLPFRRVLQSRYDGTVPASGLRGRRD